MLSLRKTMCMACACIVLSLSSIAQQAEKPHLFSAFPSTISITENKLQQLFALRANEETVIDFGSNFIFPCKIILTESKYSNMQSIIIRSTAFDNAMLQVTRITNSTNRVSYRGRILNERAADGFEIKWNPEGRYELRKFETDRILEPCFQ